MFSYKPNGDLVVADVLETTPKDIGLRPMRWQKLRENMQQPRRLIKNARILGESLLHCRFL